LIKSPKLYFLDTGLLCYLLRIRSPEGLRIHALYGSVFESYVISELIKNYANRGENHPLYFWRDSSGYGIDVVIDHGQDLLPLEIKAVQTVSRDFFKNLDYWRKISGQPESPAALIYGGDENYVRSKACVYSWSVL